MLLLGVVSAYAASRAGVPVLVAFLALGMLLGSDGPGGIAFDDPELARTVGVVGLVAILFEGGLSSSWRSLRPVAITATALATVGVLITAAVTGVAAHALLDLSAAEAFLLGAVVASTDAAAVFATLRFTALRRRLAHLLEAESGLNDPMAVALTIGMIEWIEQPGYGVADVATLLVRQLGLGLLLGLVLGRLAVVAFTRVPRQVEPFVPVASIATAALAYGAADVVEASGFLSVYVVGLALGNARLSFRRELVAFHQGAAFLAQIVLFVVLGLLVFPNELDSVALPGLALAAVLVFVARPVAVHLSTALQGFTLRERALLSWAGLRGAVPIVLATFAQSAGIGSSDSIFNAVFFVVLVSALLQGPTLEWVARRLRLASTAPPQHAPAIEIGAAEAFGADMIELTVDVGDALVGRRIRELGLPAGALIAVVLRDGRIVPPRGGTQLAAGDHLYVLTAAESRSEVERAFATLLGGEAPGEAPG